MGELLGAVADFLAEPGRWSLTAPRGVPYRIVEHLVVTLVSMGIAAGLALPPAVWLAHHKRAEAAASAVVNIGRAIPSFGLIVVFFLVLNIRWGIDSFWALVGALVALAVPPIFTNAYTAVAGVEQATVEAAAGQGMTGRQMVFQVELPLGLPVILAGLRIAMVQVIATVGIGAIVTDGGGVGRFVIDGFAVGVSGHGEVLVGAVLMAALVLLAEGVFGWLQRRATPRDVEPDDTTEVRELAVPA